MSAFGQDFGEFLTAHNVVTGEGVDFFRDYEPAEPGEVVVLHEYPGDPGVPYDAAVHRSFQVSVRGSDPDAVRNRALQIYTLLDVENRIVQFTTERWGQVYLRQPPFKVASDSSDRIKYAFNVGITTTRE